MRPSPPTPQAAHIAQEAIHGCLVSGNLHSPRFKQTAQAVQVDVQVTATYHGIGGGTAQAMQKLTQEKKLPHLGMQALTMGVVWHKMLLAIADWAKPAVPTIKPDPSSPRVDVRLNASPKPRRRRCLTPSFVSQAPNKRKTSS